MCSSFGRRRASLTRRELLCPRPGYCGRLRRTQWASGCTGSETGFDEVKTTHVHGSRSVGLTTFKGIPYAGFVTAANRFKAAPRLQAWTLRATAGDSG
jgi:hypothetical protein